MSPEATTFCPVPAEQQPVQEYEALKTAWLFSWATLNLDQYCQKLLLIGSLGWLISSPIAAASFPLQKRPDLFILASNLGALFWVSLFLIRILLGWLYVRDRLQAEQVTYEESGWYDGQVWTKPPAMLTRDRLIVSYQITPILQRLQRTGLLLLGLFGLNSILWLYL
ncbi:MAG: CGLD27 family protein [Merismopediaceae bacterium]|nr:CGLD27 family protein [Merismopediaceae bacterium]